jgi:hypothetical protein
MLIRLYDDQAERQESTHCHKVQARSHVKQLRVVAAVAAAAWDLAALRTEQLNGQDIWPIMEEAETGRRPEWNDIADPNPT